MTQWPYRSTIRPLSDVNFDYSEASRPAFANLRNGGIVTRGTRTPRIVIGDIELERPDPQPPVHEKCHIDTGEHSFLAAAP